MRPAAPSCFARVDLVKYRTLESFVFGAGKQGKRRKKDSGVLVCAVSQMNAPSCLPKTNLIVTEPETGIKLVQFLVVDHSKSALTYISTIDPTPKSPLNTVGIV